MYEVIAYRKADGEVPIETFLNGLPLKLREKTLRALQLLEEWGPRLGGEESAYLRDGIFELRTRFGSDITRVFYFFVIGKKIVLTNGFVKKSQKTPPREIERAIRYKKDWEGRHEGMEA